MKRYEGTPLPLLSNLERFFSSLGALNEELLSYGISTRLKLNDDEEIDSSKIGSKIFIVYHSSINSRGNRYLKKQYKRLKEFRHYNKISEY
jgi:hypothetical protein